MKKKLLYIIIILFLASCCNKQILLPEKTFKNLTHSHVGELIIEQTRLSDKTVLLFFDSEYTDYDKSLLAAMVFSAEAVKDKYKDFIFDCDDIAYYIKGRTSKLLADQYTENAAMIGVVFCELLPLVEGDESTYHALNIFVLNEKVYMFDGQLGEMYDAYMYTKIATVILILM